MSFKKEDILIKIKTAPEKPGVYIFKNTENNVIYVGKAKVIKKRVASYFLKNTTDLKAEKIQKLATDFEFIATSTEKEALILENSLIKLYKPKLNIKLRDDKSYPFLLLTVNEKYPRALIVRKRENDKGLYFGPFTDIKALKTSLRQAISLFPIATCKKDIEKQKYNRPCLYFQMNRCTGPCIDEINEMDYKNNLLNFIKFFEGKYLVLTDELRARMEEESIKLNFELAAKIRDKIISIEKIMQKQVIYSKNLEDEYDIIGLARKDNLAVIQLLIMREGRIINQKHFIIDLPFENDEAEIISSFIKLYYLYNDFIPKKIIIPLKINDQDTINELLIGKEKRIVKEIVTAELDNEQRDLLKLAIDNASSNLESIILMENLKSKRIRTGLDELVKVLNLSKIPQRIEGFDISTIQGSETVASCVVFQQGIPSKKSYRKFIIRSTQKQDDFSSMKEVINRRFYGTISNKEPLPDLILVDGGLGQVNIAYNELNSLNLNLPIIGLAKEFEEIYLPNNSTPIKLDEESEALRILQQVRDEAHRFAVSFHRKRRIKRTLLSSLEKIPNIGEKRIKLLLDHYSTIEKIKEASIDELQTINGINKKIAEEIFYFYHENILNDN